MKPRKSLYEVLATLLSVHSINNLYSTHDETPEELTARRSASTYMRSQWGEDFFNHLAAEAGYLNELKRKLDHGCYDAHCEGCDSGDRITDNDITEIFEALPHSSKKLIGY
jgi:hypothetical protein